MCTKWFANQTLDDSEHVIVRDKALQTAYIEGLDQCKGEYIVLWDDDDWYGPRYVESLVTPMREFGRVVAGVKFSSMYHLRAQAERQGPAVGPLPCTLAFHRSLIPAAKELCRTTGRIKDLCQQHRPHVTMGNFQHLVGMYPAGGLSRKHEYTADRFPFPDPGARRLMSYIGEESANDYLEAIEVIDKK